MRPTQVTSPNSEANDHANTKYSRPQVQRHDNPVAGPSNRSRVRREAARRDLRCPPSCIVVDVTAAFEGEALRDQEPLRTTHGPGSKIRAKRVLSSDILHMTKAIRAGSVGGVK
jgi:hypothetical protein